MPQCFRHANLPEQYRLSNADCWGLTVTVLPRGAIHGPLADCAGPAMGAVALSQETRYQYMACVITQSYYPNYTHRSPEEWVRARHGSSCADCARVSRAGDLVQGSAPKFLFSMLEADRTQAGSAARHVHGSVRSSTTYHGCVKCRHGHQGA